jgi:hypothetical protein
MSISIRGIIIGSIMGGIRGSGSIGGIIQISTLTTVYAKVRTKSKNSTK